MTLGLIVYQKWLNFQLIWWLTFKLPYTNVDKEALIDKISLLVSIYTVNKEFENRLFHTIFTHFETIFDENGEPRI